MKTTIELPDALVKQARQVARAEGATLRALVEEGLQHALRARRQREKKDLDFATFGGSGLTEAFESSDWAALRDEVYRGRGS
jgi:Arc/MetJ family transcription regulator